MVRETEARPYCQDDDIGCGKLVRVSNNVVKNAEVVACILGAADSQVCGVAAVVMHISFWGPRGRCCVEQ